MLSPVDYALWILSGLVTGSTLGCVLWRKSVKFHITIFLYLVSELLLTATRFYVCMKFGFTSPQYFYFYYYSEALQTILLYFVIIGMFSHLFAEMKASRYVRIAAVALLGATALFTYAVLQESRDLIMTQFIVELSQNMNFVGVVLTYLLWAAIMKLRESRTRLIQLVLSVGVYFSAYAANYALHNLYPHLDHLWQYFPAVMSLWLPVAWTYTFWKVPGDARLATARLAARAR